MKQLVFGGVIVGMVATALGAVDSVASTATTNLPNILWISCEDHGPDMPFYGDPHSHMPNLQKLADEGVVFDRAFVTAPVCSPSRSTIITGIQAVSLGTQHLRSNVPLPPGIMPFPHYLRKAGYYCTNNVKTDYNFPIPEGVWDENSRRAHWRNRPDSSKPFFSVFNFTVSHERHYKMPDDEFEKAVADVKPHHRVNPDTLVLPPYYPDIPVVRKDWARHYDVSSQVDVEAGRILKQLAEDGLATNTVVFFFSDHGTGMPRNKRWLYDAGLQVPLVVRWPGEIEPGQRNEELVSLIDLAPTLLSIAGVDAPKEMQGRIFLGDDKQPEPPYVFATRDRVDEQEELSRAVRDKRFKYIRNFWPDVPYAQSSAYADENPTMMEMRRMHEDGTLTGPATLFFAQEKPEEEFYDTKTDPHEIRNLAQDPAYVPQMADMRKALNQWQADVNDTMEPEPEEQREKAGLKRQQKRGRRNKAS